ncbi:hypothetical protein BX616_004471 [Lobosporangium transversale]|uniref:Uncharacterized protein n=1 Tax=Lobosporangium transversale TaxID=64571 RepID=A0A1Y2G795_9FUNG|nr:hypothetical protein BCR41DRAFT_401698 [Lobosporangium transversale]KAF9898119.1 hypothetical protein BX616_004471 [Lobosporangium transversale]ORY99708.1 hypothetical protein BCR41DRAFT_401698 [Lobosporangium transversale]|eukprot:XP_021875972.1 hypothetical protein BCR41DRAFT_401698 [Lobosporangium transversale]
MSQLPHERYVEQRSLEQYDAIDFFAFCGFFSSQKSQATFQWKTIILPQVQKKNYSLYRRLVGSWNETRSARNQYWGSKRAQEEQDAQLNDHINVLRSDALKQTRYVSNSITQNVGKRLQEQGKSPRKTFSCVMLPPRTASDIPRSFARRETSSPEITPATSPVIPIATVSPTPEEAPILPTSAVATCATQSMHAESLELNQDVLDLKTDFNDQDREHPFYGIFQALYDIAHDRPYTIPLAPVMQSSLQRNLFQYAANRLGNFDKLTKTKQKDIYVAASSIAHIDMEDAAEVFGKTLPGLTSRTRNPTLADLPQFLVDLLTPLKEKALNGDGEVDSEMLYLYVEQEIGGMASKVLGGTKIDEREAMVLKIVHEVASLCRADPIPRPRDTEQKSQGVWEKILGILFAKTRVSVVIGETGLQETKAQREANESAHAACPTNKLVTPRKVDCKLVVSVVKSKKWEFKTISNFELKPLQASSQQMEIQVRKNMRLNHSVVKKLPSTHHYFLDIHGYSAQLYCIWGHDSVHVCGRVLDEELVIPTSDSELEWFLDGRCLAALMSLKAHLLEIAQQVQREHARPMQAPEAPRTPPHRPATENHTFYTPKRVRSNSAPVIVSIKKSRQEQ